MGVLSLIPFNSSIIVDSQQISDLIHIAKSSLAETGPTSESAALCLAAWLVRPDLEDSQLKPFVTWSIEALDNFSPSSSGIFQTLGIFRTLLTILKVSTTDRSNLLSIMEPLYPVVLKISGSQQSNLLLRKYIIKWWTRLGRLYLAPRVVPWRYHRGRRSLNDNLKQSTTLRTQKIESNEISSPDDVRRMQREDFFIVPDQVEEAMGHVISALTDSFTPVRWSAAKGVGRLTERLPAICADDVLDALLKLFEDEEKDNDWHGASLALAELARRGLLLPHRLPDVIPKIILAINVSLCYWNIFSLLLALN